MLRLKQCETFLVPGVMPYADNTFETLKYSYVCEYVNTREIFLSAANYLFVMCFQQMQELRDLF